MNCYGGEDCPKCRVLTNVQHLCCAIFSVSYIAMWAKRLIDIKITARGPLASNVFLHHYAPVPW